MLVFAFLPALAALPRWLAFEAQNPLNREDPVVAAFVPVRGAILLLHAFRAGVFPGAAAGLLAGVGVCAWVAWRGELSLRRRRVAIGALGGALAAAAVLLATVASASLFGRTLHVSAATVAFEIGAGIACGGVAAPRAFRLAAGGSAGARA